MSQDSQGLSAVLNPLSDRVLAKARPACQPQPFTMLSDSRARQAFQPQNGSQAWSGLVSSISISTFLLCGHTYVLKELWRQTNLPSAWDCPATFQLL